MCLYHSAEKDAVFQARIRALNGGESLGAELVRLREENEKLREERRQLFAELEIVKSQRNRARIECKRKYSEEIARLNAEFAKLKAELDRINDAVVHARHAHRHEGTADLAREMVVAAEPITREMVAGWAARVVDLGVYGSQTVTQLKSRIRQQRVTARSYCRYISKLEARITELNNMAARRRLSSIGSTTG